MVKIDALRWVERSPLCFLGAPFHNNFFHVDGGACGKALMGRRQALVQPWRCSSGANP